MWCGIQTYLGALALNGIGFPLGFLFYLVLVKVLVLPPFAQAELTSRRSEDYLAASVGMDWVHLGGGRFACIPCGAGGAAERGDL
jgi:nucleobase:cation symporter-1, NCS1 family